MIMYDAAMIMHDADMIMIDAYMVMHDAYVIMTCTKNQHAYNGISLSIYKFSLGVCLFVCAFVSNKRQNG